jgi:hypothetical protein
VVPCERSSHLGVATFRTRQLRDPVGFVRTEGFVVSTPTREHPVSEGLPTLVADPRPVAHAFGKLAVLSEDDCGLMLTCHQLARSGEEAARAACTNATAAAAAWVGLHSGERALTVDVALPAGATAHVMAELEPTPQTATTKVSQTWAGVPIAIRREWSGRDDAVLSCTGAFNNYLIVIATSESAFRAFDVHDAVTWWGRFGLDRDPLLARLAVVHRRTRETTYARFFTCGEREHPSAPLTGLGVLALASRTENPELDGMEAVTTPVGVMDLPHVDIARDGTAAFGFAQLLAKVTPVEPPSVVDAG